MLYWTVLMLSLLGSAAANGIDDEMKGLASDIGQSLQSLSATHDHEVDWMFVVDHGGFKADELHLEYSNYLIRELTSLLYISPMYSQVGVVTFGSSAVKQIPLNIKNGNRCDFRSRVNALTLTGGTSNLNTALETGVDELWNNGRTGVHKVTVLVTSAGWGTMGGNPSQNVKRAKSIGTLVVIVLVFDPALSIFSPVVLNFASPRSVSRGGAATVSNKYAFQLTAKRGHLRRLYRHFLLASQQMPYLPLQVPPTYCSGSVTSCVPEQACVCDAALYDTYHCEKDTYEPTITRGCPADMSGVTEPGQPYATLSWLIPQAEDYSPANIKTELIASPLLPPYNLVSSTPSYFNASHVQYGAFIGNTTITQRFTDGANNSAECSFNIDVVDEEPPKIIGCPVADIKVNTSGSSNAQAYWNNVTATDNSQNNPTAKLYINGVLQRSDMRTFEIGSSDVELVYSDNAMNSASCNFTVTVTDDEPPVIVECSGPNSTIFSSDSQAYVDWTTPTFTDNSGLAVNISSDQSPGYFRIGKHTVTYYADDPFGNSEQCDFTFIVRGYPCPDLSPPLNGAIVCDNAVPGAACQVFCQNPYDFEPLPGLLKIPEKYSCVGRGKWYPTDQVPHCVVKQTVFKKLTTSYYYDGNCSDFNVSSEIKTEAAAHYSGFVEGGYFKEAWGREIGEQDFNEPKCGAEAEITTTTSTTTAPTTTTTTPTTTTPTTTTPTTTTPTTTPTTTAPTTAIPTQPATRAVPTTSPLSAAGVVSNIVQKQGNVNVIG